MGSKEETAYTFPKSFFQILLRGREGAFGMFGYGTAPYILQSVQIECSERGKISPDESNDNLLQILVLKPAVHGLRRTNMSSSNSSEHGSSTFPFQSLPQQSSYSETNLGELSGDGESLCDSNSTAMQSDTEDLSSMDVELFNPEMVESSQADKITTLYRFLCPRAGHFKCTVTNLVFEMEGKGEVLYRIDSWDTRLLDGLGQMKPGGPLYNIECCEGPISHLHLPHSDILSEENKVELTVAHFNDDNVEIITPLKVTFTHVIIHIRGLSLFGILRDVRDLLFKPYPISAQVLLFYKTMHSILYIHLLPGTVPVEEVKKRNQCNKYIQTTSKCQLIPGRKYKPSCDPYGYQPQDETFEWDFGPNYHPAFEVLLGSTTENVRIGLLDENDKNVWDPRCVFVKANSTEAASHRTDAEAAEFVDGHRETLIQTVASVIEIADRLRSKKMVGKEMYNEIENAQTSQKQMRKLYDALDSGGTKVKAEFYKVLKEKLQSLVDELEAGTSRT